MKIYSDFVISKVKFLLGILLLMSIVTSCTKYIPDDIDTIGDDVTIRTNTFAPYLGRTTYYENLVNVSNSSSLPLTFKILGVRNWDGTPAPELTTNYPVKVWKDNYTGFEKSLEEIESKREIQYRPMLEVLEKNGNIIFWGSGNSSFVRTLPSSAYRFDLEVSNSGGRKYFRDLILSPLKERSYSPSQYDEVTGLAPSAALPTITINIDGQRTGNPIFGVQAYINKDYKNTSPGNTLTISVLDSLGRIIDIKSKFKETKFEELVHGFNPKFENGKVTYEVAYPMPLTKLPTKYTDESGESAFIGLRYNRKGWTGTIKEAGIFFPFNIYEEGHWEIQFRFVGEDPKFEDE